MMGGSAVVEYRSVLEVAAYIRGVTYSKSDEDARGNIGVHRANNVTLESNTLNFDSVRRVSGTVRVRDDQRLRRGDILICAGSGSKDHIGKVAYIEDDIPYTFGGFMGVLRSRGEVLPRFLHHVMTSLRFKRYLEGALSTTTINNLNARVLQGFQVPVPPLEVQREIVRILDQFTQLEADLEAELEARRRQYRYYLDTLTVVEDSPQAALGDLGVIFGGLTGKSKADFADGNARFASYRNVLANAALDVSASDFVRISPGEKQRTLKYGDVLFTGSSESKAEVGMSSVVAEELSEPMYLNSFCIGFRPHDLSLLHPAFAKHLFRASHLRRQVIATANGVTRINMSKVRLAQVTVPLVSLDAQLRIANTLDAFYSLTTDLSAGLPAEIAARRKQYEYYRDKLLSFEELPA